MGAKLYLIDAGMTTVNWGLIKADYQGVYIQARAKSRDNPNRNALYDGAKAAGIPTGWYIWLEPTGEPYGTQMVELHNLLERRPTVLPPALFLGGTDQYGGRTPHSVRGDMMSFLGQFLAQHPDTLFSSNRSTLDYIFNPAGTDAEHFAEFKALMLKMRLWLWGGASKPSTAPWAQYHVYSTPPAVTTWRDPLKQFWLDNHMTVPDNLPGEPTTPPANGRAQGMDVSFYQDLDSTPQQIDFEKSVKKGVSFVFIRAGQGTYTKDQDFDYSWRASKSAGLLRGAYHFYDYRESGKAQALAHLSRIGTDKGELPAVLDLERMSGWTMPSRDSLLASIKEFMDIVDAAHGRKTIFYANPDILANVIGTSAPAWLLEHPLWIANYGVTAPYHKPWPEWSFWQYTPHGDGLAYGMESKGLDMDVFNGTAAELLAWAGVTVDPPAELTLEEKVARLWAAHPELH